MDIKDLFASLKELKDTVEQKFGKAKFEAFKTKDGSELICEGFEAGKKVKLKTDNGDIDAPDGQHELEDGRVMVIQNATIIEAREAPKAPETNATQTPSIQFNEQNIARVQEMVDAIRTQVLAMAEMIVNYETTVKTTEGAVATMKADQEKFNTEIMALVKKLADGPADAPAQTPADGVQKQFDVNAFKKAFRADLKKFAETHNSEN